MTLPYITISFSNACQNYSHFRTTRLLSTFLKKHVNQAFTQQKLATWFSLSTLTPLFLSHTSLKFTKKEFNIVFVLKFWGIDMLVHSKHSYCKIVICEHIKPHYFLLTITRHNINFEHSILNFKLSHKFNMQKIQAIPKI